METFIYPAEITHDKLEGSLIVTFPDFPEAITLGENIKEALHEATDCLEEAINNRIAMDLSVPYPSPIEKKYHPISLSAAMAAKVTSSMAINEEETTKAELANR